MDHLSKSFSISVKILVLVLMELVKPYSVGTVDVAVKVG